MGANEWAKRLGINDAASLETFKTKFSQLEDAAKECPVPPKDGSRCALCRRKVMLDTRFKELCNGLCSAGGSTKSTRKTINAVNSASKILEIYRSLPAAGAGTSPLRNIDESDGGIVGLSRLGESRDSDSNFQILCRSEQCQRACPEGGFCSRRCESGEADRVATVAKMVLAGNDSKRTTSAPARRKTQTASLASMMENLAKPPAPRKSSSADESSSSKADEEALRAFVVEVVGEKYWPVFEREEIEDLKTLRCCTARDLQDMKIPLGPRLKLLSNLEGLAA